MPFVTTLLITLWFPLRDSAQARQPPASGSHPLPSHFGQLILHLLGTAEDTLHHQVFCVMLNSQTPIKVIIIMSLVPMLLYRNEAPGGHGGGRRAGGIDWQAAPHPGERGGKPQQVVGEVWDIKDKAV